MFGSGIYLGPIEKARNYAEWTVKYILQVDVALGQIYRAPRAEKFTLGSLTEKGYNSVMGVSGLTTSWSGTLSTTEHVVYSPDQVSIRKVLEYQGIEEPVRDLNGFCQNIIITDNPVESGKTAFKDILNRRTCGKTAYNRLATDNGPIWICADCIQRYKIRIGSKVTHKHAGRRGEITVRILGPFTG